MSQSTTVLTRKKRGPKPTGKGTLVGVRIQPDLLEALDDYRRGMSSVLDAIEAGPAMSRPDAIRFILGYELLNKQRGR